MAKKIPTHNDIKDRIAEKKAQELKEERERVMQFLQDKALKTYFHFYLGMESLDFLKVTEEYNKDLKLHGNRFLKSLEKTIALKMDQLYGTNPEFTTNLLREMEDLGKEWSSTLFSDQPVINKMLREFKKDPEHWRKNVRMEYYKLDTDKDE